MLNEDENIVLETAKYPEILRYKGQDIIVTNGKTLLGADDKAGLAEIVSACEYLIQHPEIKHGKIRVGFTPDEEIGQGADHFDVKQFGCDFAYTTPLTFIVCAMLSPYMPSNITAAVNIFFIPSLSL